MHRGAMVFALILLAFTALPLRSQTNSLPYRMWELQDDDEAYLEKMIRLAPDYHINAIQFSHSIIHHAHQVLNDTSRAAKLRRLMKLARSRGLRNFIWTHEFERVPDEFIADGKLQVDSTRIWQWLKAKYERVYRLLPDLDGIVLTTSETDFRPNDPQNVQSPMAPSAILARVANTLHEVSAARGKTLIFRTFTQNPQQFRGYQQALAAMHPEIVIMSKCVPYDWNPFFPDNPLLGAVAPHPQIVEFDLGQEYNGQSNFPFADPSYYLRRWTYARSKNVAGFVLRTERYDQHIIGTPNEVNLYAFKMVVEQPDVRPEEVWTAWGRQRYGDKAAQFIQAVLEPTAQAVRRMLYVGGMWFSEQSQIPASLNLPEFLQMYRLFAQTVPRPEIRAFAQKLAEPDESLIDWVVAEKDSAIQLARLALQRLPKVRPYMREQDYLQLSTQLALLADYAVVFRQVAEVAFRAYLDYRTANDGLRMSNRKALLSSLQELMRLRLLYQIPLRILHMERGRESDNVERIDRFAKNLAKVMRQERWVRILKAKYSRDVSVSAQWPAGIIAPMFTPLLHRKEVDFSGLNAYARWLSQQPVDVILPLADRDAVQTLPLDQRKRAMTVVIAATAGKRLVFPVIPANEARNASELAEHALENRADGLCFNFVADTDDAEEAQIRVIVDILKRVDLPAMILMDSNNGGQIADAGRLESLLSQTDRIKAVVLPAGEPLAFWNTARRLGDRVAFLTNATEEYLFSLLSGGAGLVATGNTVFPNGPQKVRQWLVDRRLEEAVQSQLRATRWQKQLAAAPWPAAGRVALSVMGVSFSGRPEAVAPERLQQWRKRFLRLMSEK